MGINFSNLTLSHHCETDRKQRIEFIKNYVGFGQPYKEAFYGDCYHYLTDTGVMVITNAERQKIVTAYLCEPKEAVRMCKGKPPRWLQKKLDYNFSKGYIRDRWLK